MIADIIEIERAKRSIRQVAIARAGKVAELPAVSMDGSSMARALRAVWRAMRRREVESAGDEIAAGGRLERPFR
jgi:hypothetical protein